MIYSDPNLTRGHQRLEARDALDHGLGCRSDQALARARLPEGEFGLLQVLLRLLKLLLEEHAPLLRLGDRDQAILAL